MPIPGARLFVTARGGSLVQVGSLGAFKPSSTETTLTMDNSGQSVALASGVTRVRVLNLGATGLSVRFAFGNSASAAVAALTIVTNAATTGTPIYPAVDGHPAELIGIPDNATHYAVCNDTAGETPSVNIVQGV